jgi:hypothetical protein
MAAAAKKGAEFNYTDGGYTGHPSSVAETLHRSVAQYCREDSNVKAMYIGIGSGDDAKGALHRRFDGYKQEVGINEMVLLYSSSSQDNSRRVESDLVEYFSQHNRQVNRTGGGGGRDSAGPNYYVYLALRRWG